MNAYFTTLNPKLRTSYFIPRTLYLESCAFPEPCMNLDTSLLMPDITNYIGIGAGICTAISMLPQLIKIIRERKAGDISYGMLIILLAGLAGWVWYGILKEDYPIVITNSFSFLVNSLILFFTARFR
jgi:MtN3 and saliva related transmembrane protein